MPFIMVDSNEGMDRAKKKNEKNKRLHRPQLEYSNSRMVKRLQQRFGNIQPTPLTCGDINVVLDNGKTLAIERKRAGDFLNSIKEGHLKRQVQNMAENADWSIVIVEGLITFNEDDMAVIPLFDKDDNIYAQETTGWHGEAVRSVMYALMFNGTPVVVIKYPQQLPDIIQSFINFCSKPEEHMQSLPRRRIVTFPPISFAEHVVSTFPGVGYKRTKALKDFAQGQNEKNTPTLGDMLCWGSYLGKIASHSRPEGWGNLTVQNFRAALGLEDGVYLNQEVDKEEIKAKQEQARKQRLNERSKSNGKYKK